MNVEEIIQYLLIGNLYSKKIIYEMSNTKDGKIIYDINQIFLLYSKKWHIKPGNSKVDSYNVFISVERIIMISKSKESFSVNQNFELFNKLINDIPELSKMSRWNYVHEKENLKAKITNAIHEYFNNMSTSYKILNTVSFNKTQDITHKKNTKYYDEQDYLKQIRNSLISNNLDLDKFSFNQLIPDDDSSNGNANETLKVSQKKRKKKIIKIIDENEHEKSNMSKSLVRASLIVNNMNRDTNKAPNPKLAINLLKELDSMIKNISYCKKIIIVILVIIIIIEIIVIPLIIKFSYSY